MAQAKKKVSQNEELILEKINSLGYRISNKERELNSLLDSRNTGRHVRAKIELIKEDYANSRVTSSIRRPEMYKKFLNYLIKVTREELSQYELERQELLVAIKRGTKGPRWFQDELKEKEAEDD